MAKPSYRRSQRASLIALCSSLAGASAAAQDAAGALDALRQACRSMSSVHMLAEATLDLSSASAPRRIGKGSFEYWAEGDRYRLKCTTDPRLGLAQDLEYSFDGAEFRMLGRASGVISRQRGDVAALPTALPNPLFLPVAFLSDESDACDACVLSLEQAREERRWDARLGSLADRTSGRQPTATMRLPLMKEGLPSTFRVVTNGYRLERIEHVRPDGRPVTSTALRYAASEDALPRWISLVAFAQDGRTPEARVEYVITTLEANRPIPPAVFRIDDAALPVWDSDAKGFERPPRP